MTYNSIKELEYDQRRDMHQNNIRSPTLGSAAMIDRVLGLHMFTDRHYLDQMYYYRRPDG